MEIMDANLLQDELLLFGQFAHFPHKIEGRVIKADELNQYFGTDQIGDLVAALAEYEKDKYFAVDIKLSPDYLKQERHKADRADVSGPWHYDETYGLGRLFEKVDTQSPLTAADVDYLTGKLPPTKAEQYIQFRLNRINKQKFQDKLDEFIARHHKKPRDVSPGLPRRYIRKPDFKILSEEMQPVAPAILTALSEPQSINERSYVPATATLHFRGREIKIIRQKKKIGNPRVETIQGTAMRKLFKTVNTLNNGVPLHAILSVSKSKFDKTKRKQVTNCLDEINRKVKEETGVANLINYSQDNYYINPKYLQ
jgi:hypothetical protein